MASFPPALCMQHATGSKLGKDTVEPVTTDAESALNVLRGLARMESHVEKDIACGRKESYWPLLFRLYELANLGFTNLSKNPQKRIVAGAIQASA